MTESNDKIKKESRKTISIKSNVNTAFSRNTTSGKTVEIEIKRKKHGLIIEENKNNEILNKISKSDNKEAPGNLTDQEFKARVKALQDAMKEDASELDVVPEPEPILDTIIQEEISLEPVKENSSKQDAPVEKKTKKVEKQKDNKAEAKPRKTEPIVFKSSEYVKKSPAALKKNKPVSANQTRQKSVVENKVPLMEFQDVPSTKPSTIKTKVRVSDNSADDFNSRKKTKIVVKEKSFSKKNLTSGKISRAVLDRVLNNDLEERTRSEASIKRARMKLKNSVSKDMENSKVVREVSIPDSITVAELANRMAVRAAEVVKYLMTIGTIATVNQLIDGDTAEIICTEFGHTPKRVSDSDIENEIEKVVDKEEDLKPRAPIVAIMGHVDHGKTTLLDTIRKTNIAQKEAGGITQHVAAYQIETKQGKKITFIDTPGHAAFSNIRQRGAVITDIIVLVVAADDGIKDQTIEVISQAKAQNVPLIVAINKIDKPDINIPKVKSELMGQEVLLEDFGGDVLSVEISALKGINLDGLLETILLQAEMLELKANPDRKAVGTVLESRVDKGRGIVSSVIIQHGTIKTGDVFVSGAAFGKVRSIYDDKGKKTTSAGPAAPVEIVGFDSSPEPGDVLTVVDTEQKAREIAEYRKSANQAVARKSSVQSIEQLMSGKDSNIKELNVLVKADVFGSLEALVASIEFIQHPEISVKVIEKGIGAINESDVDFAKNTGAIIVGFNVNMTSLAKNSAKFHNIKVLQQNVIYHVIQEIKQIMGTMLSPIVEENYIGTAEVRKIFVISRYGTIAGCYVSDGIIKRSDSKIKLIRDGKAIFEGKIKSMKHEKDEIKESRQNHECGILAEGYNDFKEGDKIECYEILFKQRSVD